MLAGAALTIGMTGYSAWKLIGTGVLSWHVSQPEFFQMALELSVIVLLSFLLFFYGRTLPLRIAGTILLTGIFSWLHVIFFPILLSGLYAGYLIAVGRFTFQVLQKRRRELVWEFMAGAAVTIGVFCLLSLIRLGSIDMTRLWVTGTGLMLTGWLLMCQRGQNRAYLTALRPLPLQTSLMLAAVLTLLLLQAGRMNGAVDFDSIWYGVRSHVMLDSGTGIYENLGTLGVVYTYPKGWEVLTLPLAGLPSYSFPIAFNIWVTGLVLLAAYQTAAIRMKKENRIWIPFLLAAIPGIMNMAGTAKADMMTLLLQILMIQGVLRYERERDGDSLIMALAAGGLSLTMKPTAVIFSTAIAGMAMIWLLWQIQSDRKCGTTTNRKLPDRRSWLILIPSVTALAGIWGRTLKLVGVPVTSVFYQLFQRIGFTVKYPFYASGFPSAGSDLSFAEKLRFFGSRLYGVLLNPQGDDMGHVIIAWGTVFPLVLLMLWLMMRLAGDRPEKGSRPVFLTWLIPAVLVVNLVSLYSLSQIDGNYYMLFYLLILLAGGMWMDRLKPSLQTAVKLTWLPVWAFAVVLCMLTNWAWALGMGTPQLAHKGYFNHIQAEREKRAAQGSAAIWNILAEDPGTRVIALGEHPGVLTFPCNVQSYVDVSGYWGNPEVVADADSFLEYLIYADTDYLYMEKEYVDTSVRIYQIVRKLIETGDLYDVRDENGNLLIAVQKGPKNLEAAGYNLEVFDTRYIQHP